MKVMSLGLVAAVVVAGGSGDFYKGPRYCYATGTGNRVVVTNYDKGTGQEYHWSIQSSTGISRALYIDGVKQVGVEGYKRYSSPTSIHRFYGKWTKGVWVTSCLVKSF